MKQIFTRQSFLKQKTKQTKNVLHSMFSRDEANFVALKNAKRKLASVWKLSLFFSGRGLTYSTFVVIFISFCRTNLVAFNSLLLYVYECTM